MKTVDLDAKIGYGEVIYWRGKPDKKVFILRSIFNILLPFAIIWSILDFPMLFFSIMDGEDGMIWFTIPFFIMHLFPVWIYLAGVFLSLRRYKNTEYLITDKAVYISGGAFAWSVEQRNLERLSNLNMRQGILERLCKVGSVVLDDGTDGYAGNGARGPRFSGMHGALAIAYVPDYEEVFKLIGQLQRNAFTDAMYPNDKR